MKDNEFLSRLEFGKDSLMSSHCWEDYFSSTFLVFLLNKRKWVKLWLAWQNSLWHTWLTKVKFIFILFCIIWYDHETEHRTIEESELLHKMRVVNHPLLKTWTCSMAFTYCQLLSRRMCFPVLHPATLIFSQLIIFQYHIWLATQLYSL